MPENVKEISSYQRLKLKLQKVQEELQAEKELVENYKEKLKWSQAELQNLRKAFDSEKENYLRSATEKLILKILPVIDDFEKVIANPIGVEPVALKGIELLYKKLWHVLESEGVKPIKAIGEKFDPFKHEALIQVVDENCEENTILEELQKGYTLNLKVLRTSKVKVSKKKEV
jgi:molecular chaperone GrpE